MLSVLPPKLTRRLLLKKQLKLLMLKTLIHLFVIISLKPQQKKMPDIGQASKGSRETHILLEH